MKASTFEYPTGCVNEALELLHFFNVTFGILKTTKLFKMNSFSVLSTGETTVLVISCHMTVTWSPHQDVLLDEVNHKACKVCVCVCMRERSVYMEFQTNA